jgi:hypothetical protein
VANPAAQATGLPVSVPLRKQYLPRLLARVGQLQQLLPADHGGDRVAADHLAGAGQVGHHAVALLGAAPGQPESGHDLIEDQHDAVLAGAGAQRLQEPWLGPERPLQRLDDDGRQVPVVLLDQPRGGVGEVERGHKDIPRAEGGMPSQSGSASG